LRHLSKFLFALIYTLCSICCAGPAAAQVPPLIPAKAPTFQELDADRDGRVSLEEVMAYAKKKSSLVKPFRVADVDLDGDGLLTPEELKKAGITGLEGEGVIRVRDLDITPDGYVSREDLDEYFRRKHREEYNRVDADKDGRLRPSEFALFRF